MPPPAVLDQARRNIELQVVMLQEFGAVSAAELGELAGSKARRATTTDRDAVATELGDAALRRRDWF